MLNNPILSTDSYKFSHFKQYPAGTTDVFSYIEARGSKIAGCDEVVFFGLQSYIKDRLMKPITMAQVEEAKLITEAHGVPFNYEGWKYIVQKHNGMLPLEIRAVPEGTVVPTGNLMLSVHSTDEQCAWVTSYFETDILRAVWYGSTVASLSRHIKKIIKAGLDISADDPDNEINFKLHDFGFRGVSSFESAAIGGAAHLINFSGTDTVAGILHAMQYYNAPVCAYSIAASEHSTMTSWKQDGEYAAYANMVKAYAKPGATFACVIDSYDTLNAIKLWARPQNGNTSLLDQVKAAGATVVLRPDSGDPIKMPIRVVDELMRELKSEVYINNKGYRVLPNHVRVIQGDGIDIEDVREIVFSMIKDHHMSTSNIAFGMGGGLLQKVNRDTFKFAMKCSSITLDNGEIRDVYKDPITDQGKKSKRGIIDLLRGPDNEYKTVRVFPSDEAKALGRGWYRATRVVYHHHGCETTVVFSTFDDVRLRALASAPALVTA